MDFIRIGDKLISRGKIVGMIDRILNLRCQGMSQQEVANALGIDRTFVSRLETLGEVRRGGSLALIGFPVKNKEELAAVAEEEGADFTLLMTQEERWRFVEEKNGVELLNEIMALVTKLRTYDTVIMIGSDFRINLADALLDKEVIGLKIGESPIEQDVYVDPEEIRRLIRNIK